MNNNEWIIKKIYDEGLFIHHITGKPEIRFEYIDFRYIAVTLPSIDYVNDLIFCYGLAHEYAHHKIYSKRIHFFKSFFTGIRKSWCIGKRHVLPFILWDELIAWVKAYSLCKEANIDTKGFMTFAKREFLSYIFEDWQNQGK